MTPQTQCACMLSSRRYKPEKYSKLQAYSICPVWLVSECRTFQMLSVHGGLTVHVHQLCSTWSRSTQHFQEAPDLLHKLWHLCNTPPKRPPACGYLVQRTHHQHQASYTEKPACMASAEGTWATRASVCHCWAHELPAWNYLSESFRV